MGGAAPACAGGSEVHRTALGVPAADLDARPVHLAAANDADTVGAAGHGLAAALLQRHRLSQYGVR